MSFLNPLAFFLAILLPIIIIMYLLKLRRIEQVVSSTYLWRRMVRDVEANAPWQRLRRNLLLLLQLLFLLVIILSLARPFSWAEGSNGQAVILIFDTSASMAATDIRPNRLEAAKDQARLLISNLSNETRGTVITASDTTQVLVSSSQDKRQLTQAVESIVPQLGSSDMTSALELASAIAARQPNTEIVIYSDGKINLPERLNIQGQVRFLSIGANGDNQAISLITLEPGNGNTSTAFVQVINYSSEPVQRRLNILADGHLVDVHDLEIPAQGQVSIISEGIPVETDVLEAAFTVSDALTLDDHAWSVQQDFGSQNVVLVSQGNRFLETALGLLSDLEIRTLQPDDYKLYESQGDTQNLTIFDSDIPTGTLPSGNLFFIGPLSSTSYFSVTGTLEMPSARPVSEADPLLEYVDLKGVSILDSSRIPLPNWSRPVLIDEASSDTLLFVGQIEGRRVAVLAFDPSNSDLPLQVAYPILIANLMEWLLPGRIGDIPNQIIPGEAVNFTPPLDVTTLTVTSPNGSITQLKVHEGSAIYADTVQPGVYHVTWRDDQSSSFAVNLSNPQESDILPNENLSLFDGTEATQEILPNEARQEWWRLLAFIALVILIIEWLVYNRATLSKIRHLI